MSVVYTITAAGAHGFQPGDQVVITGIPWPQPPHWSRYWPWQDGDRLIFKWLYQVFGWELPFGRKPVLMKVTDVTTTLMNVREAQ